MKKKLRSFYLIITSVFISLVNLPFAFAKSAAGNRMFFHPAHPVTRSYIDSSRFLAPIKSVYDSLHLSLSGLSHQAFDYARKGLEKLIEQGTIINDSIISIIDFSQPSNMKRLYVLDIKNYRVLFNTLVAHGKNSGRELANSFSNKPYSCKSSLGFYVTGETYNGNNGYSLKLVGVEKGINDNAYQRAIVVHGAEYVDPSYIAAQGYIGRSEGCPAVPMDEAEPIINTIKDGSCLFIYNPSFSYPKYSPLLSR